MKVLPSRFDSNIPLIDRFERQHQPIPWTGCWIWTGYISGNWYGGISVNGRIAMAHRVAYELFKGIIPRGLELDHLCRQPLCVNQDHLEPVTHRENMARGKWAKMTHCIHGHELSGTNYRVRPKTKERVCRVCQRIRKVVKERPILDWTPQPFVPKTHCVLGHPLSGRNIRIEGGRRICRECQRLRAQRNRDKQNRD